MREYQDLVHAVLHKGTRKENRTGVDTLSCFGHTSHIDVQLGFPLLTTKAMSWKNIVIENLWFLSGSTNIAFLHKHGVHFWDAWADADGHVPSAYGNFWRHFPVHTLAGGEHEGDTAFEVPAHNDQIAWVVEELKRNPMSRRMVVSAWAPGNAQTSKLPPCHAMFALNVQNNIHGERELNLHLTQRSADVALGVPYNIAGYAFLLRLFARFSGIHARMFMHTLIDAHVYTMKPDGGMADFDHVAGLKMQMRRDPKPLPHMQIHRQIQSLEDVDALIRSDPSTDELLRLFALEGYDPHPAINFKVAV